MTMFLMRETGKSCKPSAENGATKSFANSLSRFILARQVMLHEWQSVAAAMGDRLDDMHAEIDGTAGAMLQISQLTLMGEK
jgi:hypothetical protein